MIRKTKYEIEIQAEIGQAGPHYNELARQIMPTEFKILPNIPILNAAQLNGTIFSVQSAIAIAKIIKLTIVMTANDIAVGLKPTFKLVRCFVRIE